jgi:UDP-glucose 4-epimerase
MIFKKRILVTGGAGFIGSHLCEALLENNNQVFIVDDLSTGYEKNISSIMDNVEFYRSSITEFNLDSLKKIDCVVHLAAQTSVPLSIEAFKESTNSNLNGFINVIDYCKNRNIPLVYASSSAVYGNLAFGDDTNEAIDLISPYATDKYATELYAKMANNIYQLSSIGLRFFNVYGERQDPSSQYSGVISVFIDSMIDGRPIKINGGSQTRDFIYVKDVIKSIINAIDYSSRVNVAENINILTGYSISIDHLFELISERINYDQDPIYTDFLIGDPLKSDGSINKLQSILNLDPIEFISLKDGLNQTIKAIEIR